MKHISSSLSIVGLVFDLAGAVIVLGADWPFIRQWLIQIGSRTDGLASVPILGIPFRRLKYLHGLNSAENILLTGRLEKVNWTKDNPPLNKDDSGFSALKTILVDELDVLPQFNRVTVDMIQKGHTDRPKVGNYYLNTSLLTVMETRYKRGIEPWRLEDQIDSAPFQKVENKISERQNAIVTGIGAKLLIIGFSIQILSQTLVITS
jgi:hypothetical protein